MGFVLNCEPSSPVWGLAEGGTKALSRHLNVAPCCGTNKEESSRRNLQKPDEMEICNYLGGEEGEGEGEEIGHRAWMGTRTWRSSASPQDDISFPKSILSRSWWSYPKTQPQGWVLWRGWCGEEMLEPCGLCWATPRSRLIPQGRGGRGDGPALPGHLGSYPLHAGDNHGDGAEILQHITTVPQGKPVVEGRAKVSEGLRWSKAASAWSFPCNLRWIVPDLCITASLAAKWESSLLITYLTGN